MSHPNLNSVYLQCQPRREGYRQARDVLLRARGDQTIVAEQAARRPAALIPTKVELSGSGPRTRYLLREGDLVYPLKTGMNFVGRFRDSDVVLPQLNISRRHCAIVVHSSSGCELHDLASKNGTYLNGERLARPVWLVVGDQVQMCDRQFTFLTDEDFRGNNTDAPSESLTLAD